MMPFARQPARAAQLLLQIPRLERWCLCLLLPPAPNRLPLGRLHLMAVLHHQFVLLLPPLLRLPPEPALGPLLLTALLLPAPLHWPLPV